jgi:hypothetical protein
MITDALQLETFVTSPTFRRQVAGALTVVGVERWKAATAVVMQIDVLEMAGTATAEHLIARQIARTERTFLENALAVQGVNLGGFTAPQAMPGMPDPAKEGITRLINMLLAMPSWTWTVNDWMENQADATAEIAARMNDLLASLTAAPVQQTAGG